MKLLEDRINTEALVRSEDILDVKSFLNESVDPQLMNELGKDFAKRFENYEFDAFVTVETSGIAPSVFAGFYANKPLIILKKEDNLKDAERFAQEEAFSFTKNKAYYLTVSKESITDGKFILLDDFLARGSVVKNVRKLLEDNGSELVAVGICISKNFQNGYKMLQEEGFDLYAQAQLAKLDPETKTVEFE
ncbi:MAG TPA: xanthine phosphoribosyltransferase [Erysipelothrix sp.]